MSIDTESQLLKKIFYEDQVLFERLRYLAEHQEKLKQVKDSFDKPILITLLGSPRTGKTSISYNIYDFLKKSKLNTIFLEEPANAVYKTFKSDEEKKTAISDKVGFNSLLMDNAINRISQVLEDKSIQAILCDRGFFDSCVWFNMYHQKGIMNELDYTRKLKDLEKLIPNAYNITFVLYANPFISLKRDYLNSLSLEDRKFITEENLADYLAALFRMRSNLEKYNDLCHYIDTSPVNIMDVSINVAENICHTLINDGIQKKKVKL